MALACSFEAFHPGRAPGASSVRECEILRFAATPGGDGGEQGRAKARREVLEWTRRRVGAPLPKAAWNYEEFDKRTGGRDCKAVRIADGSTDIRAVRANDPDKNIAGRIWTTEIVVGWDVESQQAAIASMPAHIPTGAT